MIWYLQIEELYADPVQFIVRKVGKLLIKTLLKSVVLFLLASKIVETVIIPTDSKDRINAFVMNDSVFSRNRSKTVELLTKLFDRAHHEHLFGFRILTVSWTDGNALLPVAKSLLSSENQKYGSMELTGQIIGVMSISAGIFRSPKEQTQ